jgi:ABC-type Mn2+/Zn2+ transport system permease subunit
VNSDDDRRLEEKRDRQMIELLNELRVALPGVQLLFGFLLTVPFAQGFIKHATPFQERVYYVTLLFAALAITCFIAPSTAHRLLFHQGERPWLIEHASRMLIAGSVCLALALVGAVLLVTDFLFPGAAAVVFPVLLALVLAGVWFTWPLSRRRQTGPARED